MTHKPGIDCPRGGTHELSWRFEYIAPVVQYGQISGGGRYMSDVFCTKCKYRSPYYPDEHEALMDEPYTPRSAKKQP